MGHRHSNSPPAETPRTALRGMGLALLVAAFYGLAGGAAAASAARTAPAPLPRVSLPFAVADFDGDLRPDVVAVDTGTGDVLQTRYRIELQFSAAGRQTILLVAPAGGLQVAARDVNGDHAPDLVVTTTWLNQPVAIFLNDGHGGFLRVDPSVFPEAFTESETHFSSATNEMSALDCVPANPRQDVAPKIEVFLRCWSQSRFAACLDLRLGTEPFLISRLSRAPPVRFPRS